MLLIKKSHLPLTLVAAIPEDSKYGNSPDVPGDLGAVNSSGMIDEADVTDEHFSALETSSFIECEESKVVFEANNVKSYKVIIIIVIEPTSFIGAKRIAGARRGPAAAGGGVQRTVLSDNPDAVGARDAGASFGGGGGRPAGAEPLVPTADDQRSVPAVSAALSSCSRQQELINCRCLRTTLSHPRG